MAILRRVSKSTGKTAYQVMVDRHDPVTGERKRVTIGTYRTKKEAQQAERDALTQQERGTLLDPAKTTVAEMLESWLTTKHGEITGQSIRDYEIIIRKHVIPALGSIPVQKLTAPRLQAQYGTGHEPAHDPRLPYAAESSTTAGRPVWPCGVQRLRQREPAEAGKIEGRYLEWGGSRRVS
ncbi:MAG: Arm DNA-binding domain-containing protein [Thermomicrobiales bacterium]